NSLTFNSYYSESFVCPTAQLLSITKAILALIGESNILSFGSNPSVAALKRSILKELSWLTCFSSPGVNVKVCCSSFDGGFVCSQASGEIRKNAMMVKYIILIVFFYY